MTIDEVPLEWCFAPGVKLDFSGRPDGYLLKPGDFADALKSIPHELAAGEIVLVQSGAGPFWGKPEYMQKGCGAGRVATLWLLERGVRVVGTDAWSWDRPLPRIAEDYGKTHDPRIIWEGHFAGIEKGYCHMEKLAGLDRLPAHGFKVACFPVKVRHASAGWVRAVAILES